MQTANKYRNKLWLGMSQCEMIIFTKLKLARFDFFFTVLRDVAQHLRPFLLYFGEFLKPPNSHPPPPHQMLNNLSLRTMHFVDLVSNVSAVRHYITQCYATIKLI